MRRPATPTRSTPMPAPPSRGRPTQRSSTCWRTCAHSTRTQPPPSRKGTITVGLLSPAANPALVAALTKAGTVSFALELVPRISRAQSMDALTSQSLVAGYRCVLEAAIRFPRFFPLYMTAAGTIPPAKVLVLGAGVAGLQAIATAKRLGAKVSGVRRAGRIRRRGRVDGGHVHHPRPRGGRRRRAATRPNSPKTGPTVSGSCSRRT